MHNRGCVEAGLNTASIVMHDKGQSFSEVITRSLALKRRLVLWVRIRSTSFDDSCLTLRDTRNKIMNVRRRLRGSRPAFGDETGFQASNRSVIYNYSERRP